MKSSINISFQRISILALFIAISFLVNACPHHFKIDPKIQEHYEKQKQNKRTYLSSLVHQSQLVAENLKKDWQKAIDEDSTLIEQSILQMEIREIDASYFPDSVVIKAVVYDFNGRMISGLAPPYIDSSLDYRNFWTILNDACKNQVHQPQDFSVVEVRQTESEPYAISFLLDHSGSMGNKKVTLLRSAVKLVLRAIKLTDYVSILNFESNVNLEIPLTNNRKEYIGNFNTEVPSGGGTAIYDALLVAIKDMENAPDAHKKTMILFTDGLDNNSKSTLDSVKKVARQKSIRIFTIAYGFGMLSDKTMKELADYTGGKFYHLISTKEFPLVFRDIYYSLNNYYKITYKPENCQSLHKVEVGLSYQGLDLSTIIAYGEYDKSVFVVSDPIGTISFINIEFDYNKAEIKPESFHLIDNIVETMNKDIKLRIKISGHTDSDGDADYNLNLSKQRANAVKEAIVKKGIDEARIKTTGYGESRPVVPNDSEENKRKNRRTEFEIIGR